MKILIIALLIVGGIFVFRWRSNSLVTIPTSSLPSPTVEFNPDCVPAFVDGGGPYYKDNAPFRNKISPENSKGQVLYLSGKVFKKDCQTIVPNVVIDVWQADETGEYPDDWYRGKIKTNDEGSYELETVKPKGYGEGTAFRPPHLHFKIFVDDREVITSQIFFPESAGQKGFQDAFIMKTKEVPRDGQTILYGQHNIVLPE